MVVSFDVFSLFTSIPVSMVVDELMAVGVDSTVRCESPSLYSEQ